MDRGRLIFRHRRAIAPGAIPLVLVAAAPALPAAAGTPAAQARLHRRLAVPA